MRTYEIEGPDGFLYTFDGPEDASKEDIIAYAQDLHAKRLAKLSEKPKEPTGGIGEAAKGAAKRGLASAETAITAPFIGGEEAGVKGVEAQKAIEERPGFSWEEIKRRYEQEGLLPAAGEAVSQVPGILAEQAPTLGAIMAGGRLGAIGGGALAGPAGAVVGGLGGAALYPFLTQSGANIERQVQEQQAKGEPVNVNLPAAYGAGAGQTALEMALGPEALLARRFGTKTAAQISDSLAKEGALGAITRGTAKTIAEEVPTEIAQQALERAQAGLPLSPSDQQALDEYLASGVGAALAGPLGGPMRLMERGDAQKQVADREAAEAEAEQQRLAQEAEQRRIEDIISQSGGQTTLPGFEPIVPREPVEEGVEKTSEEKAVDHLLSLNKPFTNPSQVKDALKDTEFSDLKPKKLLDLYKEAPVQTSLFEDTGELNADIVKSADQRQAVQDKATADMQAKLDKLKEGQNLDIFGAGSAPRMNLEEAEQPAPSQGGSANLTMQQAMKEAEQQTAIDKANRERQALYGLPEGLPMNQQSADLRAQALEEGAPYQQRALDMQQSQQQALLQASQKKASDAMQAKLDKLKEGQNLDIFGAASAPRINTEEVAQELPSQGGSANLQIQEAMREAERQTAIDQANKARQDLRVSPEGVVMPSDLAENRAKAMEEGRALYEEKVAGQQGGQRTVPGIEPMVTTPIGAETEVKKPVEKAAEFLKTLPQEFKSAPKVKEALAKTEFKDLKPNQVLQEYKQIPTQTSLFDEKLELPKAFSKPLNEQASKHVADNNLSGLLTSLSDTHENEDVKKILNKINALKLDTKLQTGDISGAGEYDPNTNTITFNPNTGLNEHTAIHEPVHAAIAHVLNNTDHPLTKAFDGLYQQVKSKLGDQYGGTNLQEFASEAVSNPEFQDLLKKTKANNGGNLFQRMIDAVAKFFGFRKEQSAYDRAFKHINDIIDVSHEVSRKGGEKLAHVGVDPDLKAATQMYAVPKKAAKPDLKQRYTEAKDAITKGSLQETLLKGRVNIAHSGASIQKHYRDAYNGAIRDALNGTISGHVLLDQALDSAHFASSSLDQGIPVFENGVPKIKQDSNNIFNAQKLLKDFGDRIGSREDAEHAVQAFMLAQNYDRILRNNDRIQKEINALKATGRSIDKAKAKKLQERLSHISDEQKSGIAPGLEYAKRHPEIKKIADMWEAIKNADVDFQEKSGVISKELADRYRNDSGYVPMYRVMNDMENANPGAKAFYKGVADVKAEKHFEGSDKDVKNIFENMLARHMWAVESAIRNNANRRLSEDLGIVGDDGKTKYYSTQPTGKNDTTAPVWIEGKRKWVEYSDPTFVTAIKGVEPVVSPMIKMFGNASRLLRMSVTSMPTFQLVQILKDAPRAALLSGVDHPFQLMGRVVKDAATLYGDMLSGRDNPILKEMERAGISSGYGHTAEEINDRMRRKLGLEANSKVKQALDIIEKVAAISDAAQRKAVYEQTLKETGDKDLAEDRARNIINWKRHGANHNVRVLSQIVPFMNAYIQSMDVLLSAMSGTGISGREKAAAQLHFAQVLGQMMILSGLYAMMVADDEYYQKMDDTKKLNSLVIPGTGVHIPVASEIGLLVKAIPELTYQYVTREGTKNPLDATKVRKAITNALGDALLSPNLTPQLVKPIVEIATNHNFLTDTPIIGHGLERKATSEQFVESTSELAKLLGKTNLIAPVNADHFIKGYGGTMASIGLTILDSIVNQFSDVKRPAMAWNKNPLISPFINDPKYKDQINGYYDLLKESDKVTLKLKDLKSAGKKEEAKAFREENKDMLRVRQQVQNLSNRMEMLREQHKRVYNSNLSADDKRAKLDAIDERYGKILRNVNALRVKAGM